MSDDERARIDRQDPRGLDRWLRRRLEPDEKSVARVVRRSLASEARPPFRPWPAIAAAGLGTVVLAAAILTLVFRGGPPGPSPAPNRAGGNVRIPTITNASGDVEVLYPPEPPAGKTEVSRRAAGDRDRMTIYNADGIVVALAPVRHPHHFILGGKP